MYKFRDSDRTLIHRIESTVIGWSHQLYSVLCTDSSQPLLEDKEPTPYVEIKFWQRKALNLQLIHDQVKLGVTQAIEMEQAVEISVMINDWDK